MKLGTSDFDKSGAELIFDGQVLPGAKFTRGEVVFTTPPGSGEVKTYIKAAGVESNEVEFEYKAQQVKFKKEVVWSGEYSVLAYCFGYLFAAEYVGA